MPLFDSGGPQFGLDDVKIAEWLGNGTYGTAVDLPSVQMLEGQTQTVNAQLEGDDIITDTHARARSEQVRVRFGSIKFDALSVLIGKDVVTSGNTRTLTIDNLNFPYFGICGRALSTQDNGDTHMFIPKCKVMEGFTLTMQYGQYVIPEITCTAVFDSTYQYIMALVEHDDETAVTIPPDFNT